MQRNPSLLVAHSALRFVLFPIPVVTIFWHDQIGLSLADIMLLTATFSLSSVLLEFPSGYIADRIGYRRSLLVGSVFWVLAWPAYVYATTFAEVVVAEVLLGAAAAFFSGADAALLFVSLDASGRSGSYTRWEGRQRAAAQMAEAGSSSIGGWLYALGPRVPFWLQIPFSLIAFGVAATLREPPRTSAGGRASHVMRALHVVRASLWHHRRLRTAMALSVVLGLSSFMMVWLVQPYMQARGIPTAWFGPIWAAAHVWLALVSLASARVAETFGVRATLLACALLVVAGYALLATTAAAVGVAFYLCLMTVRGLQAPLLANVLQRDAPDDDRASVLSLNALLFRLSFVVLGPPLGVLVDRIGLDAALGVLAIVLGGSALAAWWAFRAAHAEG